MTIELRSNLLHRYRPAPNAGEQRCEWPGCDEEGPCRAPKSPENLQSYRWFCKEHAREYNKSWNYYEGMSDKQVEADVRQDTVWRRPTWQIGSKNFLGAEYGGFDPGKLNDPLGIFEEHDPRNREPEPGTIPNATIEQRRALIVFSLDAPLTAERVKQRYKELVKRYHPDAVTHEPETSQKTSDEKIKEVNQAYRVLLDFLDL
jgi:hypothetical protein